MCIRFSDSPGITATKADTNTKADFLFERANVLSKKPARKISEKIKKNQLFETNLHPN